MSSVMAIIMTVLAIRIISTDGDGGTDMAPVVSMMIVGYFLFLGGIIARLIRESLSNMKTELMVLGVFVALAVVLFLLLPTDYDVLNTKLFRFPFYFFGIAAILHLVIAYVPFISRGSDGDFWEYNRKVFIRIVESGFFSGVLFLAALLAMVALDKLFGIEFEGLIYGYVAASIFGIFNSIYFLSKFPALDYDDHVERPLSAFLVFTQFLLIPITVIYLLILYAYGVKIILDGELPKGWIGHLSLWFSVIGVFSYLLNYLNPRFSNRAFLAQFIRYFFLVLIGPSVLLMISLYRRISDYGVTEERYALAMIASWLVLVILLYGILRWRSLKWLPISLSVVIAFGLFSGPMSIFGATLSSQEDRLYNMLTTAGLLGDIEPDIGSTRDEILDQLRFMDDRSDLSFINDWIASPIFFRDESVRGDTSNYQLATIHFNLDKKHPHVKKVKLFSFEARNGFVGTVEQYKSIYSFELSTNGGQWSGEGTTTLSDGKLSVTLNNSTYKIDLIDSVSQWSNNYPHNGNLYRLSVPLESRVGDLYFSLLKGRQLENDSIRVDYARGFLLIE